MTRATGAWEISGGLHHSQGPDSILEKSSGPSGGAVDRVRGTTAGTSWFL